ncbi:MAG TPA: M48 family metallopeptidase [Verrucomicrobiae bacterium]|nr:M48 family metallopeptidase [Verrucomicrobiae bacterium]
MDFFQQQDKARKKTKLLVFYFTVAVICIIAMIYAVAMLAFFYATASHSHRYYDNSPETFSLWNPTVFLWSAIGSLAVISLGSAYKTLALAGGGSAVAESLGGRLIATNTNNPDERKLLNVVEEMSIASGVPMPQVYVLDNEDYINAFAAGHSPSNAVVAVTRNCMTKLTRDELQGVIGHEFSHILNGDMRLNLRLMGILFGILCIATIGRIILRGSAGSGNRRGDARIAIFGLLLLIIGSIGVFFGRLIQAAVSRQREFLADASSVQFTRNPLGLSGALQKVGGYGSRLWSPQAPDAGHLFFCNGIANSFSGMMATHPPLDQRIRAVDPTWDGKYKRLELDKVESQNLFQRNVAHEMAKRPPPMPQILGTLMTAGAASYTTMDDPLQRQKTRYALPSIGNPTPMHLEYAEKLRDALPDNIRNAAHEPLDATALIYAMLLSCEDNPRTQQLTEIAKRISPAVSEKTAALFPDVSKIAARVHLPIINLALGALKQLTASQFEKFSDTLIWLVNFDGKTDLFEFVLQKIVQRHLAPNFRKIKPPVVQFYSVKPLVADCAVLLSALAYGDTKNAQAAFDAGAPYLRSPDDSELQLREIGKCGVDQIDDALNRLVQAAPQIKKNLIDACIHVVGADGSIAEMQAELLRAFADTLDCPMPPALMEIQS